MIFLPNTHPSAPFNPHPIHRCALCSVSVRRGATSALLQRAPCPELAPAQDSTAAVPQPNRNPRCAPEQNKKEGTKFVLSLCLLSRESTRCRILCGQPIFCTSPNCNTNNDSFVHMLCSKILFIHSSPCCSILYTNTMDVGSGRGATLHFKPNAEIYMFNVPFLFLRRRM